MPKTFTFEKAWVTTYRRQKLEVEIEFAEHNGKFTLKGELAHRAVEMEYRHAEEFMERFAPDNKELVERVKYYRDLFFDMADRLQQFRTEAFGRGITVEEYMKNPEGDEDE